MNYSRKQLEALGEPFGESATALKPGGRIYGGGGGGGPSTQTQVTELPEWARPYAQQALGRGEALSSQPYQAYGGERFAGFSPMQIEAQQKIGSMGPAGQIGEATNLARGIGSAAQRTSYDPGTFTGGVFNTGAAGQYMSPFMEAAMEPQLREAQRTSAIQATQQAGQAVQSGAFGGGRAAILEAERQRNLGTQLGDIRARGYQTAFEQAQNQFNQDQQRRMQAAQLGEQSRQFGAGLGLQGLGIGLNAAAQLGQLGQLQFGQEKDVLGMQRQVGAEQQELRQKGLSQAYQDFLDERNAPYKQLGFFADLIRGQPLGQQSTRQMYEAPPSMAQTIGSLGMGAYGLKQLGLFAEGGSVTSDEFVESSLEKMSDQQLAQAERVAMMRGDKERLAMIAEEKAMRASERRGLAGGFNQMPQQTQQQMLQAARGGIVAFEEGGEVDEDAGDPTTALGGMPSFIPMTPEQRQTAIQEAQAREAQMRGDSPLTPFIQDLIKQKEALGSRREENKGLIALAAAQALSKGSGLRRGIGEMFGAIGATAASVNKDLRDSERLIKQSELALAQAEEARKNMQFDKATALVDRSETLAAAADQRKQLADTKRAEIASRERTAEQTRKAADIRAEKQREAQLEAARIQANRPGETAQAMGAATKAFAASGLPESEAQLKAAELVLGRSSVTDWSRARDDKLNAVLAADPTIKDDPVRLAQARATAGTQAASDLRGFAQRAESAQGIEDIRYGELRIKAQQQAILDPGYREADRVLRDPKASAADKQKARETQESIIDRMVGRGMRPAPAAGSQTFPTPNAAAISALKNGLGTREQFDAQFGPGAAAKALGK